VKPGYKQTEVGVIPEEWDVKLLASLSTEIGDGIHSTPNYVKFSDFHFVNGNNLVTDRILITDSTMCVSESEYNTLRKNLTDRTILLSINGTIGNLAFYNGETVVLGKSAAYVSVGKGVSKRFISYCLKSRQTALFFDNELTGTTIRNLSLQSLRNTPIPLPPTLPEQRAIAGALSDVDALLVSLDRLIAKKRDLKQAAMQQLLTGHTRLPDFREEWVVKRLGDIFTVSTGRSKSAFIVEHGAYWICDMGSVSTDGRLIVSKHTNYHGDFLNTGDLIMPKDDIGGGKIIGKVGYIDTNDTYVLGDHVYCLRATQGAPRFLAYAINSHRTNTALRKKVIGSAQLGLGRRSVTEQEVQFPPLPEQTAIAEVLSDMDTELAALEQRRDKTRALKQGMMQELLTGRTRLI